MRNMVKKHGIIGNKEYQLIVSLIGLCVVENKGEVKYEFDRFFGMVVRRKKGRL